MALIVQKYGGTSVGNTDLIQRVAQKVADAKAQGNDMVVVVSAMSGETNRLIQLARSIKGEPSPREYAMLVSTGEQVTISLLSIALQSMGVPAVSLTGAQAGIQTNPYHKNARIKHIDTELMSSLLKEGKVVIVAGFQGVNEKGEITTLGRGGSDTTAVALAAALQADECQIYTDVEGVYTADPRIVPDARLLKQLTFEEMLELASLGAKVLQPRSVELIGNYNVPLRVLSSFKEGQGTLITCEEQVMEQAVVSGLAFNRSEAKLTIKGVPDQPGVASAIIGPISEANIDIDMIIQNIGVDGETDFTFTVHRDEFERTTELAQKIADDLGANTVVADDKIAKISLVGVGMRSHAGIANRMFVSLGEQDINIQMISTSEIKISVVVAEEQMEEAVRTLHLAFALGKTPEEEFDPLPMEKSL